MSRTVRTKSGRSASWTTRPFRRRTGLFHRIRGSEGVTLVEMLVVIAVLGVLSILLVLSLQGVRNSEASARCAAHLRQLGTAYINYAQDNGGRVVPFRTVTDGTTYNWNELLRPYVDPSLQVEKQVLDNSPACYHCPAFLGQGYRRVANGFATSYVANQHAMTRDNKALSLFEITFPAKTLLLADGKSFEQGGGASVRRYSQTLDGGPINYEQHPRGANFLFVDGHVEVIAAQPDGPPIHRDGTHLLNASHPF